MSLDEFVDISTEQDGGLLKKILVPGSDSERPSKGCVAKVHYVGTLGEDDTVFDSSREHGEPLQFTVGEDALIKGFELGVASMSRGEKAVLRILPHYAYGDEGHPPKIPGGATLNYELELLGWDPKLKEPEEMTVVERSTHVQKCKVLGNNAFKEQDWPFAVYSYEEGIRYISYEPGRDGVVDSSFDHGGEGQLAKDHELVIALLTNLAACYLKTGEESLAADKCTEALNLQPDHMKALFRRAQARFALGDWDRVMTDVSRMLELEPDNKAAEQMRRTVEVEMKKGERKSKAMFSKMFNEKESRQVAGSEQASQHIESIDNTASRGRADAETLARRKIVRAKRTVGAASETRSQQADPPVEERGAVSGEQASPILAQPGAEADEDLIAITPVPQSPAEV